MAGFAAAAAARAVVPASAMAGTAPSELTYRTAGEQSVWAGIAILNGLPATTAPIGLSDSGLPIGVQIIGGFLDDRTTIAFAEQIEREFGGFTPPPSL